MRTLTCSTALAVALASMAISPAALAQKVPQWVAGPTVLPGTSKARNPDVAFSGGVVHIVYRIRAGGIGHVSGIPGQPASSEVVLGMSNGAAVSGNKNYPAVDVDGQGRAHVVWAPPSAKGNGAYYARVDAAGAQIGASQKVSTRWIEYVAMEVIGGGVHMIMTAIADANDPNPDAADGLYDVHGATSGGALTETEAWQFPNFAEPDVAEAPWMGLAVLARWDVLKRRDLQANGTWNNFSNESLPPNTSSVGRPYLLYQGNTPLWSVVGWSGAAPTNVYVTEGNDNVWTKISNGVVYDPASADGEPRAYMGVNDLGHRAVAWLSAQTPRLRFAIGEGTWGTEQALPGTDTATTFAMTGETDGFRVVFADDTGTLYVGRVKLLSVQGAACTADGDCATGHCVDARCCDTACGGDPNDCQACSVAAGASVNGTCAPLTGKTCNDGNACTQIDTCQAGACTGGNPVVCNAQNECQTAACKPADGTCVNSGKPDGTACPGGSCMAGTCKPTGSSSSSGGVGGSGAGSGSSSSGEMGGFGGGTGSSSGETGGFGGGTGSSSGEMGGFGGLGVGGAPGTGADAPGGCDCRSARGSSMRDAWGIAALVAATAGWRRRRRTNRDQARM